MKRLPFWHRGLLEPHGVVLGGAVIAVLLGVWGTASKAPEEVSKVQTPKAPFPYESRDVHVDVGAVRLSGTLTIPPGESSRAGVLLVSGAGAQDRNGTLGGHQRFLLLADRLSRAGLVVLRLDDRGVGGSAGDLLSSSLGDLVQDARGALSFLRQQPEVDRDRLGILGASQGSLVAARVAAEDEGVAFLVLLSPLGLPSKEIFVRQNLEVARRSGASEADLEESAEVLEAALALALEEGTPGDESRRRARGLARRLHRLTPSLGLPLAEAQIQQQAEVLLSENFRSTLRADPRPDLQQVRAPVLAISGALDLQLSPEENLAALREALEEANNPDVTLDLREGLNHLLQPAETGLPKEYSSLSMTIAPDVLNTLDAWLRTRGFTGGAS